ncbi:MAG: penicillin acylase family protein [Stenotrophobium sp.]
MRYSYLAALPLALALMSCGRSTAPTVGTAGSGPHYDVTVTRTAMGIPHIKAADFGSMGYGYGYAFASDNLCILEEDLLTIRGQRAQYLGRNGNYSIPANGTDLDNVTSDYFWKFAATDAVVQHLKATAAPEVIAATDGFVAGFNRYIHELKTGQHPGRFITAPGTVGDSNYNANLACANAPWLTDITEADMFRRYYRLSVLASASALAGNIVAAQPPSGLTLKSKTKTKPLPPSKLAQLLKASPGAFGALGRHDHGFASNMYGLGKDATTTGMPMLLGNPHFPWTGSERLYLAHAEIPGKLNIMGASLYGLPAVLIGFTDHFAWSHTVSTAYRFTIYELTLDPTDLTHTHYLYDGKSRAITGVPITIEIKEADGSITKATKTLYRSHYGPMLSISASGVPILGWTALKAYTIRDANAENDRMINQFFKWDQAQSLDEFESLHKSILGVPWVNTVATGPGGQAYYGDITVVPNVTNAKDQACASLLQPVVQQLEPGLPVLDGSRSACEWGTDADAPAPGIFGPSHLPSIKRDDYVRNSNDSYWLANPEQPLTGYANIIGSENSNIGLRPRLSILQIQRRLAGTDGLPGTKFDLQSLEQVALSSQIYSAELARDQVVSAYCSLPTVLSSSGPVDPTAACAALKAWDMSDNLDSKGGHLWREFWRNVVSINVLQQITLPSLAALSDIYWLTPFSSSNPINTPNTLNVALPTVELAFGDAINTVLKSGHPFDATMGSLQHPCCIDRTPIFGGEDFEGAFTVVDGTNVLDKDGYRVPYGNSYIQAVTWDANGVVADAFVTYSESSDPANPHFSDYTHAYSAKQWLRLPFHDADVQAQALSVTHLTQ